jgi:hypothetical protein
MNLAHAEAGLRVCLITLMQEAKLENEVLFTSTQKDYFCKLVYRKYANGSI